MAKIWFLVCAVAGILILSSAGGIIGPDRWDDAPFHQETTPSSSWYIMPKNYAELVSWYRSLEQNYSNFIEVFKANELYGTGMVDGGYDDYYVRITNESRGFHKPEVLFLGSAHGPEKIGTVCLYWFSDWLMRYAFHPDYDNPQREWLQWLLDNREIYIEISHNPYGFDRNRRWDYNGWDLNREADYNGPGENGPPECWGSVTGKTLVKFVNNHTIRAGCDFHEGLRKLMYPWFSSHWIVKGVSPISHMVYNYAPPDFYFYDAASLRVGDFMGDYGGDLNAWNIGPVRSFVDRTPGAIVAWAYGADVEQNPAEDRFVKDEKFGNYPGSGIMWHLVELYDWSSGYPGDDFLGNDTVEGFGMQVRRYLLHQIDLAQPYLRWVGSTPENNSVLPMGTYAFQWQVNGSLVVDHTSLQWGTNPDPVHHFSHETDDHDEHAGDRLGGTGWDGAADGVTHRTTYTEYLTFDEPGDYYVTAKAQVDQIYRHTLAPLFYGKEHPYLRIVKERTDGSYYEEREGTDGLEIVEGHLWWYSPVIHVTVK